MTRLLSAAKSLEVPPHPRSTRDALWLTTEQLEDVTGWRLKPEGLCRAEACVPLSEELRDRWVRDGIVNAAGLWRALGRPILSDRTATTWMLGESADDSNRQLRSTQAPDFTLPDITGKLHSLSDYRGRKVFLATWASW